MSNSRLGQFYGSKKSPLRMLGYLAAPLVYWPTGSVLYGLGAAIVSVWGIDRYLRSRIHYRIRLYDAASFAELPTRFDRGHGSIVKWLAFSPAGDALVSCGIDGTARLWDVATGQVRRKWTRPDDYCNGACFSPDGKRLLDYSDTEIQVHDVETGETVLRIERPGKALFSQACFSADGSRIAAVLTLSQATYYGNYALTIWDPAAGRFDEVTTGFGMHALAPDGSVLAAESADGQDGQIVLWSCSGGGRVGSFGLPANLRREPPGSTSFRARGLYVAPEGRIVVVTNTDHEHFFFDPASGELRTRLRLADVYRPVLARLSPDGSTVFVSKGTGGQHQSVLACSAVDGRLKGRIDAAWSEWGVPFAISPDGTMLAIAGEDQPAEKR